MANSLERSTIRAWLLDPWKPTAHLAAQPHQYTLGHMVYLVPILAGIALLSVTIGIGMYGGLREQFFYSYLVGWTFCLSLSIGALFVVLIKHLTKASWVVVLRRIPEVLAASFPLLAVLAIPILASLFDPHGPYHHWTDSGIADPMDSHFDEILAGKVAYLNIPFFLMRVAAYFAIWIVVSGKLYKLSLQQDMTGDPDIGARQRHVSAWGLPLLAISTAFASYDFLMSLDPHWFSTIFGVYFFSGAFMSAFCVMALTGIILQSAGMLRSTITREHYHDLGKLMFGFVVFWAYIAYSQYMLYWYGNIPEETAWFRHRLEHGWEVHSAILLFLHFILPFVVLLPRSVKRSGVALAIIAVWLLIMQWFDHHWIAMPVLHPEHATIHWLDVTSWLGLGGLFLGFFAWRLSRHSLVPERDPLMAASLAFENH